MRYSSQLEPQSNKRIVSKMNCAKQIDDVGVRGERPSPQRCIAVVGLSVMYPSRYDQSWLLSGCFGTYGGTCAETVISVLMH